MNACIHFLWKGGEDIRLGIRGGIATLAAVYRLYSCNLVVFFFLFGYTVMCVYL